MELVVVLLITLIITAVLLIIPLTLFIFSLIALKKTKKKPGTARRLAIVGMVSSLILTLLAGALYLPILVPSMPQNLLGTNRAHQSIAPFLKYFEGKDGKMICESFNGDTLGFGWSGIKSDGHSYTGFYDVKDNDDLTAHIKSIASSKDLQLIPDTYEANYAGNGSSGTSDYLTAHNVEGNLQVYIHRGTSTELYGCEGRDGEYIGATAGRAIIKINSFIWNK